MISLLCSLQELNFNLIFKSSCKQSIVSAERGGGMATKTAKKKFKFQVGMGITSYNSRSLCIFDFVFLERLCNASFDFYF